MFPKYTFIIQQTQFLDIFTKRNGYGCIQNTTGIFAPALFIIAPNRNVYPFTICPSTGEQINKFCSFLVVGFHSAIKENKLLQIHATTWVNLKGIILSE